MDVSKTLAADIVELAVIFHNVRSDNYGRCAIVTDILRHVVDIINTLSVHLLYQQVARIQLSRMLTLSPPIRLRLYTLPYWSNAPFLIFDIRALWHS